MFIAGKLGVNAMTAPRISIDLLDVSRFGASARGAMMANNVPLCEAKQRSVVRG